MASQDFAKALSGTHRLLVALTILTIALAFYGLRTDTLTVANGQLVSLEQMETAAFDVEFTQYLKNEISAQVSAKERRLLAPDDFIWIEHQPLGNLKSILDEHRTISRLLESAFPKTHLGFESATLMQIHSALATFVFLPDIGQKPYVSLLERCIQATNGLSGKPLHVLLRVFHNAPADDFAIPGVAAQRAEVLLTPSSEGGPKHCFEVTEFSPLEAREVLSSIMPNSLNYPLPLFEDYGFPDTTLDFAPWAQIRNMPPLAAELELRRLSSSDDNSIPKFEFALPTELLSPLIPLMISILQLLLLSHARAAAQEIVPRDGQAGWAWVGSYPDITSRVITIFSIFILPIISVMLLRQVTYYARSRLSTVATVLWILWTVIVAVRLESRLRQLRARLGRDSL